MSKSAVALDELFKTVGDRFSKDPNESLEGKIDNKKNNGIAIIGMACRTADAQDLDQFWENLLHGRYSIKELPKTRKKRLLPLVHEGVFNPEIFRSGSDGSSMKIPHIGNKGYMDDIDLFDPDFFGMTAKEARLMDPMQRKWLETAYHALEDAGYGGRVLTGSNTGVFVGSSKDMSLSYSRYIEYFEPMSISQGALGNLTSSMPGRLSHFMDFQGPSIHIDTACSSGLVAVHMACSSILNGECDQAVAGGVRLRVMPFTQKHPIGIESPTDTSRPFDIDANGTAEGEGIGAVVLKPLDNALSDGDYIYAVIKGSALTQDGKGAGLGVPNGEAQKKVMLKAWELAGINPSSISFFEAHGTATKVGDPIEVEAISSAFNLFTSRRQFCALGAVKSNLGHLYEASGIFGLVKAARALEKQLIPPTIHFQIPNRSIAFEDSPLYVPIVSEKWPRGETIRRCCVSSFGISGTNCHVVLEESPEWPLKENISSEATNYLFTLSAGTKNNLLRLARDYIRLPDDYGKIEDICYTANKGRGQHQYRIAFCVKSIPELKTKLSSYLDGVADIQEKPEPGTKQSIQKEIDLLFESSRNPANSSIFPEKLADLYMQGADIPWEKFYRKKTYRTLPLPVYPYHERPYWIEMPLCVDLRDQSFYNLNWEPNPLPVLSASDLKKEEWLVLYSPSNTAATIISMLKNIGHDIILCELADQFSCISPGHFLFSENKYDLDNMINSCGLSRSGKILNLLPLKLEDESMIFLFFDLAKTLSERFPGRRFEIINVASAVYPLEQQPVNPKNRLLFTFARSLSLEVPDFQTRSIDVSADAMEGLTAVLTEKYAKDYFIALRKNLVYTPVFDLVEIESEADDEITVTNGNCYLITGGLGGLGLEVARYFAGKAAVNLVLIGRNPARTHQGYETIIREIEDSGSTVLIEKADVTDRESLKNLISGVKVRYGKITGIIHAAGVLDDGPLFEKNRQNLWEVMAPKIAGTINLHELTQDDPPDFMILFSSLSAVFNNIYQAGYASANAFMDAYSQWRNALGMKTVSINWPGWEETGMAQRTGMNHDNIFKVLKTSEGLQLFEIILKKSPCNIIPGIINTAMNMEPLLPNYGYVFSDRMKYQWDIEKNVRRTGKKQVTVKKVNIKGRAINQYSAVETKLCEIIGDIFGLDEVDINTGFSELGGDSITALSLYYQLPDFFGMESNVSVEEFVGAGSLERISALISNRIKQ